MEAKDTVLESCEVACLTGDLIACPLPEEEQEACMGRINYKAGQRAVVECLINDFYFSPVEGSEHHRLWQAKLKEWGIEL